MKGLLKEYVALLEEPKVFSPKRNVLHEIVLILEAPLSRSVMCLFQEAGYGVARNGSNTTK